MNSLSIFAISSFALITASTIQDSKCEFLEFSKIFGAKAYIGVRFKYTKWLFLEPDKTPRTKNGNYKVEKDYALEKGLEIDEIAGIDKQMKF